MTRTDAERGLVDADTMRLLIELARIVQPPMAKRLRALLDLDQSVREVTIQNADFDLVRLARFVQGKIKP